MGISDRRMAKVNIMCTARWRHRAWRISPKKVMSGDSRSEESSGKINIDFRKTERYTELGEQLRDKAVRKDA